VITIRIDRNSAGHVGELHCYFPEWAARPPRHRLQLESERNSYSAGGYAEEFGYGVQADVPTAAPTLVGNPEACWYWRVQVGALHPGYPECPRPVETDIPPSGPGAAVDARGTQTVVPPQPAHFKRVRADARQAAPASPAGLGAQLVSLWTEFRILRRHL